MPATEARMVTTRSVRKPRSTATSLRKLRLMTMQPASRTTVSAACNATNVVRIRPAPARAMPGWLRMTSGAGCTLRITSTGSDSEDDTGEERDRRHEASTRQSTSAYDCAARGAGSTRAASSDVHQSHRYAENGAGQRQGRGLRDQLLNEPGTAGPSAARTLSS